MSAIYPEGESPEVNTVKCSMPKPVTCNTFGDMVAINHFWGGGGHREAKGRNMDAYETVALDLLADCGIRQIRWWVVDRDVYLKYYNKGIGVYTYTHGDNLKMGNDLGVWTFAGAGNEPDLSAKPVSVYIKGLKAVYGKKEKICPKAVICAPSSGLEDTSIEWLDKFYQQGGKDYFDVLDLHTYCKIAGGHKQPEGYPKGAPEAMFDNMRKIRLVTDKYKDSDKPVISTEFGYSEAIPNNPSGKVTPQIKAEYLVRGLIIHHVLGFKRVFMYSFWDEGDDKNFTEHTFGLIDFKLQKKPGYYAVKNLIEVLGKCQYVSEIKGLKRPAFGYQYRNTENNNNVYVMWDGTGRQKIKFKTSATSAQMTDLFGKVYSLIPEQDGTLSVVCSPSAVYLETDKKLEYIDSQKLAAVASGNGPAIKLVSATKVIPADAKEAVFQIEADNAGGQASTLRVVALDAQGKKIYDKSHAVQAGKQQRFSIPVAVGAATPALEKISLQAINKLDAGSFSQDYTAFIRRLPQQSKKAVTVKEHFAGMEQPVYTLSNDKLVVSIDALHGARMLELIERGHSTNQINMDYTVMPNLPSIPFAYGIWSTVNGKLKNSPMSVKKAENGVLELSGKAGELDVTERWALSGSTVSVKTTVSNPTTSEQKLSYRIHPEYTVGGTGDSVTDVFFLPKEKGVEKLPFWSGLGQKKCGKLNNNRWAVLDKNSGIALVQSFSGNGWSEPRIWFGQGSYNMELQTEKGLSIPAGKSWTSSVSWSVKPGVTEKNLQAQLTK